jgi:uncharacterized protein with NRDE domain
MCTVTFVPFKSGFIFTSNRDEKINRPTISPKIYEDLHYKLMYPKDKKAGGTWIVAKNDGTCIVLLNGAFEKHQLKTNYTRSRGTVLMEMIASANPLQHFSSIHLEGVEPFTLIVFQNNKLMELKWDETEKYAIPHTTADAHIWSSSTLYNLEQRNLRKHWFENFKQKNSPISPESTLSFHKNTHPENEEYGLVINRDNNTKTVSITQLFSQNNKVEMIYVDMNNNEKTEKLAF